jgi:hypothetical protein
MIQLHGGIAITWEHDAHLFFKRAHGSAQLFGPPGAHMTRLAELVGITRSPDPRRPMAGNRAVVGTEVAL